MEPLIHYAPYIGWVYPNETVIEWSIAIVVYPYITGLVAGAFTVSSLYQVFGFQRLKPELDTLKAGNSRLHSICGRTLSRDQLISDPGNIKSAVQPDGCRN